MKLNYFYYGSAQKTNSDFIFSVWNYYVLHYYGFFNFSSQIVLSDDNNDNDIILMFSTRNQTT